MVLCITPSALSSLGFGLDGFGDRRLKAPRYPLVESELDCHLTLHVATAVKLLGYTHEYHALTYNEVRHHPPNHRFHSSTVSMPYTASRRSQVRMHPNV